MMLTLLFIIVAFVGQLGEVFARSLVPSADAGFERGDVVRGRMVQGSVSYFDNPENLLNIQIQEFDVARADSSMEPVSTNNLNGIERLFVLVKTETTPKRDKRYIQHGSHLTPCLFKICNLGRKRQPRVFS